MDPSQTHVIDSDGRVADFIPAIMGQTGEAKAFSFPSLEDKPMLEGAEAQDFEDGLSVISMDDVVSGERKKILQEMEEERNTILTMAKEEADRMIAGAQTEVAQIREAARVAGEIQGKKEGQMKAEGELKQKQDALQAEYDRRFRELEEQEKSFEPAFANLVVSLVRKLTGVVCENKKDVILYLLGSAMRNLEKTTKITLHVSRADMARVSAKKDTFRVLAKEGTELDIIEDASLEEKHCMIETDSKVIDCSLDAQLDNLEEHMKLLNG